MMTSNSKFLSAPKHKRSRQIASPFGKWANSKLGMSLIEVIITMFMVGTMFVLYAAALQTVTLNRKLRYENLAYHVANKQMEDLRAAAFSSLPSSGTISDSLISQLPSGSGSFTVADHLGFNGLKEITVTVNWNDGVSKQVVLTTLAGSGGINP